MKRDAWVSGAVVALASALVAAMLTLAWLNTPDPDERGLINLCKYICDQGKCPPCPDDPTPPGRTAAPVIVREAPAPPGPIGDL